LREPLPNTEGGRRHRTGIDPPTPTARQRDRPATIGPSAGEFEPASFDLVVSYLRWSTFRFRTAIREMTR
jgi:hypothetical protein